MIRPRSLALITFLVVATVAPLSQQTSEDEMSTSSDLTEKTAYKFGNGKAWNAIDLQSRITWTQGIEEGMALLLREAFPHTSVTNRAVIHNHFKALLVHGFRTSDVVKQMDAFYQDSSNLRIPVVDAYKYAIKKMQGARPRELEDYAAELRQLYNR